MGRRSPQTQAKRQRERDKQDKRRAKVEKRAARKEAKLSGENPPEPMLVTESDTT